VRSVFVKLCTTVLSPTPFTPLAGGWLS